MLVTYSYIPYIVHGTLFSPRPPLPANWIAHQEERDQRERGVATPGRRRLGLSSKKACDCWSLKNRRDRQHVSSNMISHPHWLSIRCPIVPCIIYCCIIWTCVPLPTTTRRAASSRRCAGLPAPYDTSPAALVGRGDVFYYGPGIRALRLWCLSSESKCTCRFGI